MKTADIKTILEKFSFGPLDNYGMVISSDSIPRIARKIKQLEKSDSAQSSATDKLIIEKMGELIKAWEKTSIMAGASKYIKMTEKISRLEAELQALKDKRK